MTALGAPESGTSVYRDLVASMISVKALHRRGRRKVRLAGIDATYQRLAQPGQGRHQSTIFVVDFSDGHVLNQTARGWHTQAALSSRCFSSSFTAAVTSAV
jgi:hypothetical protein